MYVTCIPHQIQLNAALLISKVPTLQRNLDVFFDSAASVLIMLCYRVGNCEIKLKYGDWKLLCALPIISPTLFGTYRAHM